MRLDAAPQRRLGGDHHGVWIDLEGHADDGGITAAVFLGSCRRRLYPISPGRGRPSSNAPCGCIPRQPSR